MPKIDNLFTLDAHNDSIILREVRGDVMDSADAVKGMAGLKVCAVRIERATTTG